MNLLCASVMCCEVKASSGLNSASDLARRGCHTRYRCWSAAPDRFGGLDEPVLETDFTESGIFTRDQRSIVDLDSEVACSSVGNDSARIASEAEALTDEFIEAELLRT